jgi:threonine/homoserine/homoserine lactone efflux protein
VPPGSSHPLPTMLGLSAVFMLMTFVVFAGYGACAALLRARVLGRPKVARRIRQTFAVSFVALGARLALTHSD